MEQTLVLDFERSQQDPRWGQQNRDRKAEVIFATLLLHADHDLGKGLWLDIGCGSGGVAATLATRVEHVVGIDPEPWDCWQAFRQQHPNLNFRTGSYRDLEELLAPDSVDVVVCNQVYEHVDDPTSLLGEIHRVLKPGGLCYFAGPNLLWPIEPHVFWPFVHWLPRRFAQRWMSRLGSSRAADLDAWSWSYWRLTRLFQAAGFRCASAIHLRLMAEASTHEKRSLVRAVARIPARIVAALTPLAPGFVFMLTKPSV